MREPVTVACVQAEPAILDRDGTIAKLEALTAEAAGQGAQLVVFPETFVPAYPTSAWAKELAGWATPEAKQAYAWLARESVEVPGPDVDRMGAAGTWLRRSPGRSSGTAAPGCCPSPRRLGSGPRACTA